MSRGIALTDDDRAPWLTTIRARILDSVANRIDLIVACSALKREYRDVLGADISLTWVYLKGAEEVIRSRVMHRPMHFMHANMLPSQFQALEEPSDAIIADILLPPDEIVEEILAQLKQ